MEFHHTGNSFNSLFQPLRLHLKLQIFPMYYFSCRSTIQNINKYRVNDTKYEIYSPLIKVFHIKTFRLFLWEILKTPLNNAEC